MIQIMKIRQMVFTAESLAVAVTELGNTHPESPNKYS